jgi:hypothetical protein
MTTLKSILPAAFLVAVSLPAVASVSLEFQLGGVEIPAGSIAVLVADRSSDGFVPPSTAPGTALSPGEVIGADDVIIAVFAASELGDWGNLEGFAAFSPEIRYENFGLAEGQELILHVFPERIEGESIRSGEPFVSYRSEDLGEIAPSSTMNFALPADGGAHLLATIGPENGGTADLSMVDLAPLPYNSGDGQLQDQLSPEAIHSYFFELTAPGFLDLAGNGGSGLRAELFGPNGDLLASSDGSGSFSFVEDLLAGWYLLRVSRETGGAAELDYNIAFSSEGIISPDLAVGSGFPALTGRDVIGGAAGQTVGLISRRAKPVVGYASLANRGGKPEILSLQGNGGSRLCSISYLGDAGNITSAIITGTFRSPEMSRSDDAIALRVLFSPNKRTLTKKRGERSIIRRRTFASLLQTGATTGSADPDRVSIRVSTR